MASKWAKTIQRGDLKVCPFCGTRAIQQMRLAESDADMQHRITCGNPFCFVDVATPVMASEANAVAVWQDRPCDHDFKGWREFEDGNGGEQVCTKCGLGAMAHTLRSDF